MAEKMLNINLEHGQRKKFTIDGDENRVLELNTSDLGIFARAENADAEIEKALMEMNEYQEQHSDDDSVYEMGKKFVELDKKIREQLDYLFDTNFSEVVVPHGTMVDPINGEFRFIYLLEVFSGVFTEQITEELKERNDKIRKRTKKYVNKVTKA